MVRTRVEVGQIVARRNEQRAGTPAWPRSRPAWCASRRVCEDLITSGEEGRRSLSVVDAEAIAELIELVAVDVVGRVQVLGLGDELEGVVTLQSGFDQDLF